MSNRQYELIYSTLCCNLLKYEASRAVEGAGVRRLITLHIPALSVDLHVLSASECGALIRLPLCSMVFDGFSYSWKQPLANRHESAVSARIFECSDKRVDVGHSFSKLLSSDKAQAETPMLLLRYTVYDYGSKRHWSVDLDRPKLVGMYDALHDMVVFFSNCDPRNDVAAELSLVDDGPAAAKSAYQGSIWTIRMQDAQICLPSDVSVADGRWMVLYTSFGVEWHTSEAGMGKLLLQVPLVEVLIGQSSEDVKMTGWGIVQPCAMHITMSAQLNVHTGQRVIAANVLNSLRIRLSLSDIELLKIVFVEWNKRYAFCARCRQDWPVPLSASKPSEDHQQIGWDYSACKLAVDLLFVDDTVGLPVPVFHFIVKEADIMRHCIQDHYDTKVTATVEARHMVAARPSPFGPDFCLRFHSSVPLQIRETSVWECFLMPVRFELSVLQGNKQKVEFLVYSLCLRLNIPLLASIKTVLSILDTLDDESMLPKQVGQRSSDKASVNTETRVMLLQEFNSPFLVYNRLGDPITIYEHAITVASASCTAVSEVCREQHLKPGERLPVAHLDRKARIQWFDSVESTSSAYEASTLSIKVPSISSEELEDISMQVSPTHFVRSLATVVVCDCST
jgi:hypothetical protein